MPEAPQIAAGGRENVVPAAGENEATVLHVLQSVIAFFRCHRRTIGTAVVASLGLGTLYLFTAAPTYTAVTTLILDMRNVLFSQQKSMVTDIALDSAFVESQVEVFKSRNVALPVIEKFKLVQNPEFVSSTGGLLGDFSQTIGRLLGFRAPASEFELKERALRAFEAHLGIKRVGLSFTIEVSFRSVKPDLAADIANAVAETYLLDQAGARVQAARRATAWLQESMKELREQTLAADRALVEFKAKNNIINANGRLMNEQQLTELNTQLVNASAQRAEAQARLDGIKAILTTASPNSDSFVPAVTDSLKSDVINKLRTQYLDLAHREADWSARYGVMHEATVHMRNQMREIRSSIIDELGRIAETYKNELEVAKQREDNSQRHLAGVISDSEVSNEAQVTMRELEGTAQTYRTLYDDFRHRRLETLQQESFPMTEGRIISPATTPLRMSSPRASLVFPLAILFGLVLGILLSILFDLKLALQWLNSHSVKLTTATIGMTGQVAP